MLTLHLDPETEARLARAAEQAGQTADILALEAIREHLEDLEDLADAIARSKTPGRIYSAEEVKRELDL